jgi:hypothetical protein
MINCILFSYDRAMQLDAVLQSFFLHCYGVEQIKIDILYKTSSDQYTRQYHTLINEYSLEKNIEFHCQNNFHRDVLNLLNPFRDFPFGIVNLFYNFVLNFNQRAIILFAPLIAHLNNYVLFLVDDNIFVRDFYIFDVINTLSTNLDAVGFSLRLGTNTTYCYTLKKAQTLPQFINITDKILKFDWTNSDADFGYPLEISSSVYRVKDILPLIFSVPFENPNTLEGHLAQKNKKFRNRLPNLLCFNKTITFCNPVNKVQEANENIFGISFNYSSEKLAQLFDDGYRIDTKFYNNFLPNACHQEVDLTFRKE